MFKSALPYLIYGVLSILVILFSQYAHGAAVLILYFYQTIDQGISLFFNQSQAGLAARHVLALIISPLILTGIPALVYYFLKRKPMPYFLQATWLIWILIVLSSLLLMRG